MRCPYLPGPLVLSALLLACQLPALAQDWEAQAGLASAQAVRGLAHIDRPLAELSGTWRHAAGWSLGAAGATALHGPQASLSASAGYGWPLAGGADAYVTLGRADYRRANNWRLRYDDASVGVNLRDRLFLSVSRSFHVHAPAAYGPAYGGAMGYTYGYGTGTVAKEALWRQDLPHGLTLVAGVGHAALRASGGFSYWYGSVGLRATLGDADLEATWIDSDSGVARWWGAQARGRWVGSVRWNF
jgi:hypothetical protein